MSSSSFLLSDRLNFQPVPNPKKVVKVGPSVAHNLAVYPTGFAHVMAQVQANSTSPETRLSFFFYEREVLRALCTCLNPVMLLFSAFSIPNQ